MNNIMNRYLLSYYIITHIINDIKVSTVMLGNGIFRIYLRGEI